jgi:hypothetical protein
MIPQTPRYTNSIKKTFTKTISSNMSPFPAWRGPKL